jgi:hypothetical protein
VGLEVRGVRIKERRLQPPVSEIKFTREWYEGKRITRQKVK